MSALLWLFPAVFGGVFVGMVLARPIAALVYLIRRGERMPY